MKKTLSHTPVNRALWLGLFALAATIHFLYVSLAYPVGGVLPYRLSAWFSGLGHWALILSLLAFLTQILRPRRYGLLAVTVLQTLSMTGVLFILANYFYYNIQNIHLNYGITILFEGGPRQFADNLRVSGLSRSLTAAYLAIICGILTVSLLVSHATEKLMRSRQWSTRSRDLLAIASMGLAGVFIEQALSKLWKQPTLWAKEQNATPVYLTFFDATAASTRARIPVQMQSWEALESRTQALLSPVTATERSRPKPHLFLIILESFRSDAIGPQTAPHLAKLQTGLGDRGFGVSYANSNATHNAWWSIFHGQYAHTWDHQRRRTPLPGSPWLQWFKNAGYKIQVFCQPVINLGYFDYGQLIYGKNMALAQRVLRSDSELNSPESDRWLVDQLLETIATPDQWKTPTLTVLYLDGAHFNYGWPADFPARFKPFAEDLDLTRLPYMQGGLELILNRYKNAVSYVDHLFGKVVMGLKKSGLYDNAALVITGDHGEEFLEHGTFLHSHTLYEELLRTPILFKTPKKYSNPKLKFPPPAIASQIHIMPTLADFAGMDLARQNALDGRSLLRPDSRHQFALSSAVYMSQAPYRYALSTSRAKLFFDLKRSAPERSTELLIRKVTTLDDREWTQGGHPLSPEATQAFFEQEFAPHLRGVDFLKLPPSLLPAERTAQQQ